MKRSLIITLVTIVAVILAALICFVVIDASRQDNVTIDCIGQRHCTSLGPFPVDAATGRVDFGDGIRFSISSTTTLSAIDRATIDRLRRLGCRIDSSSTVLIGRNTLQGTTYYTKTYSVDLPMAAFKVERDSNGTPLRIEIDRSVPRSYVRNVEFVEAAPGLHSTFGVDLLSRFAVEYNLADSTVSFHTEVPDNFEFGGAIYAGHGVRDLVGTGSRYYLDMKVDHERYEFLINTEMDESPVKLPQSALSISSGEIVSERLRSDDNSEIEATVDRDAWCEFGNRGGGRKLYYYSDREDFFELNPVTFFSQDMVIDFKNDRIMLRPTYNMKFRPMGQS